MMCISFYDNSVVLCRLLDHDDELPRVMMIMMMMMMIMMMVVVVVNVLCRLRFAFIVSGSILNGLF